MQITLRIDDELHRHVKSAAAAEGRSMNGWITAVLQTALDPDLAGDEAERLRARLRRAGLLWESPRRVRRPDPKLVARAAKAAAKGTPLSDLVSEGRGPR